MKNAPELKPLLGAVLAADDPEEALLRLTLSHVARRRRRRRMGGTALAATLIAGVWAGWFLKLGDQPMAATKPVAPAVGVKIVRTTLLPSAMVVTTRADEILTVGSAPGRIRVVETGELPRTWEELDDQELLAMVAGHPAMLLRRESGEMELIFVNPADRTKFGMP